MNSVALVGRLARDLELKRTANDRTFCNFTLAVNRAYSSQDGEQQADFISCIAWGKTAENLTKYMSKGSQISVAGYIQTGSYDDKDGKRVYTTTVVANQIGFLTRAEEPQAKSPFDDLGNKYEKTEEQIMNDDIPF